MYPRTAYCIVRKKKEEREEEPAEEEVAWLDGRHSRAEEQAGGEDEEVEFHGGNCNADWNVGILFVRSEPAYWVCMIIPVISLVVVRINLHSPALDKI